MQLTIEKLRELNACTDGIKWYIKYGQPDTVEETVVALTADNHFEYANWLIPRMLDKKGAVLYACFAAELVLPLFESAYPEDKRPQSAIEAARAWVKDPTDAARAAAAATDAAAAAAAWTAGAATDAAAAAAARAAAAGAAAWTAAAGAARAAAGAEKIINYGLTLIKEATDAI